METPEKTASDKNPANGRTADDSVRSIGQRLDKASDSAQEAWGQTRDAFSDLSDAIDIKGRVRRQPYGTLAAALGIGYVLGGGIFTPLTARIVRLALRFGVRAAFVPLLKDQVAGLAEALADGDGDGAGRAAGKGHKAGKRT
jgi:ElaB/YqjD/DUF883 family membrane-anchored ribosome-binding protein